MKLFLCFVFSALFTVSNSDAQKIYSTRNGKISFSAPSDEDVKAVNNEATSRIADNGQMTFSLLIKGFKFKYAEMQEHFNDQYLESSIYPRADFKGTIQNLKEVNFNKNGTYPVTVKGDLTMHGTLKNITVAGTLEVTNGKLIVNARFTALMKDFAINASSVTDKVTIDISCQYQ